MNFYSLNDGDMIREGEIGVQVIKGQLVLVTYDGKTRTHYTSDGRHVALMPAGAMLSFKPTLILVKDEDGNNKYERI